MKYLIVLLCIFMFGFSVLSFGNTVMEIDSTCTALAVATECEVADCSVLFVCPISISSIRGEIPLAGSEIAISENTMVNTYITNEDVAQKHYMSDDNETTDFDQVEECALIARGKQG